MTSKKFVEKKLRKFIRDFPQATVRYEFHEGANAHFIELNPEVYHSNEFDTWYSDVWDKFVERYAEGMCVFPSDYPLMDGTIENAELTLYGAEAGYPQAAKKAARQQQGFCFGLLREKAGKEVVPV
jgi:hypothetical protein